MDANKRWWSPMLTLRGKRGERGCLVRSCCPFFDTLLIVIVIIDMQAITHGGFSYCRSLVILPFLFFPCAPMKCSFHEWMSTHWHPSPTVTVRFVVTSGGTLLTESLHRRRRHRKWMQSHLKKDPLQRHVTLPILLFDRLFSGTRGPPIWTLPPNHRQCFYCWETDEEECVERKSPPSKNDSLLTQEKMRKTDTKKWGKDPIGRPFYMSLSYSPIVRHRKWQPYQNTLSRTSSTSS